MNQVIKIVFNDDVTVEEANKFSDWITLMLATIGLTAIQFVDEEECKDEPAPR